MKEPNAEEELKSCGFIKTDILRIKKYFKDLSGTYFSHYPFID